MLEPGNALFRHHRQLTARLAGRLGTGEAEDLASEAVARSLARPAPDGRQAPWLETIFRNLLADRGRRWARRRSSRKLVEDMGAETVTTPEELVLAAERARAVARALPDMPAELREAVEARFFAEQDYDEMAARRGITPTTARTRVHRGLARLRQALAKVRALLPVVPTTPALGSLVPAMAVALLVVAPQMNAAPADGPAAPLTTVHAPTPGTRRAIATDTSVAARSEPAAHPTTVARRAKPVAPVVEDDAPVAVKRLAFDEDEVEGELQQPGIILIDGDPRQRRMGSLIEIPRSFAPSMTKMIEDL